MSAVLRRVLPLAAGPAHVRCVEIRGAPRLALASDIRRMFAERGAAGLLGVLREYMPQTRAPASRWIAAFESEELARAAARRVSAAFLGFTPVAATLTTTLSLNAFRATNALMRDPEAAVYVRGFAAGTDAEDVCSVFEDAGLLLCGDTLVPAVRQRYDIDYGRGVLRAAAVATHVLTRSPDGTSAVVQLKSRDDAHRAVLRLCGHAHNVFAKQSVLRVEPMA